MVVWTKTEATLSNSAAQAVALSQIHTTAPSTPTSIPEALPQAVQLALPVRLKVKPPKAVTIDTTPSRLVPPMAPPPLPPARKQSISGSIPAPILVSRPAFGKPSADQEQASKKRKDHARPASGLDDMLGEEIDTMERAHHLDAFDELFEQPKSKRTKAPGFSKASPDKAVGPRLPFPSAPVVGRLFNAEAPGKNGSSKGVSERNFTSNTLPTTLPGLIVAYAQPQPPVDLPPTKQNATPFKQKRSRSLLATLRNDSSAYLVCDILRTGKWMTLCSFSNRLTPLAMEFRRAPHFRNHLVG